MSPTSFPHRPQRIVISGGTGLVGSALAKRLRQDGHEIHLLVRSGGRPGPEWAGQIPWSLRDGSIDTEALEGMDAVVHLAGAPIAVRWTESAKQSIRDSRVEGTRLLATALARLARPPRVFVSASAVGWFGRGIDDRVRVESDPPGDGFLADVAVQWEGAADPARSAGVRTVHPRLGVVLTPEGGALEKMLPVFRAGVGGPIGSGRQWFPWISLEDVLEALDFVLRHEDASGPVHVVSPHLVRQAEFARVLGRVLRRPSLLPLPTFAVKLLFGEMGEEALLSGVPVAPRALEGLGFAFRRPDLEGALRSELGL